MNTKKNKKKNKHFNQNKTQPRTHTFGKNGFFFVTEIFSYFSHDEN